eukprot:UN06746
MTMMSILFAPVYPQGAFEEDWWWVGLIIFVLFFVVVTGMWIWMRKTGFGKIDYKTLNTIEDADVGDVGDEEELQLMPSKGTGEEDKDATIKDLREQLNVAEETIAKLKNQES